MAITREELGFPAPSRGFEHLRDVIGRQLGRVELEGTGVTLDRELVPNSTFELGKRKFDKKGRPIPESRVLGHFTTAEEIAEFFETMGENMRPITPETI